MPAETVSDHQLSEDGRSLPDLPRIKDKDLHERIFTHKSLMGAPTNWRPSGNDEPKNNERLAFIGAHIVPHIVSTKLYDMQPPSNRGELTVTFPTQFASSVLSITFLQQRLQHFVVTENIAKWSDWYGLTSRLKCHPSSRASLLSNTNTKAQVFHAFVGALFLEDRTVGVEDWIRSLMNYQIKIEQGHIEAETLATPRGSPGSFRSADLPEVNVEPPTSDSASGSSFPLSSYDSNSYLDSTTLVGDAQSCRE